MEEQNLSQTDPPAVEIPNVKVEIKRARKSKNNIGSARLDETNPVTTFTAEVIGKLVTFYCFADSGVDNVEGVPMVVLQDPNGRWFTKLFASDGSRLYLYLDQVSAFYVHGKNNGQVSALGNSFDMNQVDPSQLQGQTSDYYSSFSAEQLPDEMVQPNRRNVNRGQTTPLIRRVPQSERTQ